MYKGFPTRKLIPLPKHQLLKPHCPAALLLKQECWSLPVPTDPRLSRYSQRPSATMLWKQLEGDGRKLESRQGFIPTFTWFAPPSPFILKYNFHAEISRATAEAGASLGPRHHHSYCSHMGGKAFATCLLVFLLFLNVEANTVFSGHYSY